MVEQFDLNFGVENDHYSTNANECLIERSMGKLGLAQGPIFWPLNANEQLNELR